MSTSTTQQSGKQQETMQDNSNSSKSRHDKTRREEQHKNQLARRASASARMQTSSDDNEANQLEPKLGGKFGCRNSRNRYSFHLVAPSQLDQISAVGNKVSSGRHHKSASALSSSSSASDSAFSQSQATLESESENSTNSLLNSSPIKAAADVGDCVETKLDSYKLRRHHIRRHSRNDDDGDSNHNLLLATSQLFNDNHFQIVWRNLNYKIPEKPFERLRARFWRRNDSAGAASTLPSQVARAEPLVNKLAPLQQTLTLPPNNHLPKDAANCKLQIEMELENGGVDSSKSSSATKQRQVIFSNLNGCIRSGELTAILGPSGSGKTTFLKCLTNSLTKGVSGSIDIKGGMRTSSSPSNKQQSNNLKLCIIPQKDYLFDNLTVMENLLFASRIKNIETNFDHTNNVCRVANLLGLQQCLNVKTNKLSGGQYKRVSIAQELLSQPDILILDEPTSGLDSRTCFSTVSVLRDLIDMSRSGLLPPMAIVMTIHQPQTKIFNLFHHVYVLSSMGQCVYEGKPEHLADTVADRCKLLPSPDDQNPASFIIDLASEVYGTEPVDRLAKWQHERFLMLNNNENQILDNNNFHGQHLSNNLRQLEVNIEFNKQQKCLEVTTCKQQQQKSLKDSPKTKKKLKSYLDLRPGEFFISERLKKRDNHNHSFWSHTKLLISRLWLSMRRDSLLTTTRVAFHILMPFVLFFVFSHKSGSANACPHVERELNIHDMISDTNVKRLSVQHDELILTFENLSLFFILLYSFSMCALAVTALSFPLNMQILIKETSNGWYTMPRFVMAKTIADLPIELTMPVISVILVYAITGQPSSYLSWRMFSVTAVMTLCSLISQTQGLLFGAYFMNNVQAAVFVSQASALPWIMLSGFTTRVHMLPKLLQYLSFGSIYRLGIESIIALRYGFGMCPCDRKLVDDTPVRLTGFPEQLKSVLRFYMDMYSEQEPSQQLASTTAAPTTISDGASSLVPNISVTSLTNSTEPDLFEKIASTLSRASTFGLEIGTCDDVKPFIMTSREVDESVLPTFVFLLVSILIGLRILLFYVVRIRTT